MRASTPPLTPPAPPGDSGSFGGDGTAQQPTQPYPGADLQGLMAERVEQARGPATDKVRMFKPVGSPSQHTTCSALFLNNKIGWTGLGFANTTIFRDGTDFVAPDLSQPCASGGVHLFVLGPGSPYVFVCLSFTNFAADTAEAMLIHEWLHRAGQLEDLTSTTEPGNPPTSDQIQAMVEEACNDPQVIE